MDTELFDRLVIALGRQIPRRSLVGLLGGLGLTGFGTRNVAAQSTCLPNGTRCGGSRGTCCSGLCKRKRGTSKKFCRQAPGQGICTIDFNVCANPSRPCDDGSIGAGCNCWVSMRGYSFCGSPAECFNCETDADCAKRPTVGQAGDHCVHCAGCDATSGRRCIHPCPNPDAA
jgi:hypothetical protein